MQYKIKAVQNTKHYDTIMKIKQQAHDLAYWIDNFGVWYGPIRGCFKAGLYGQYNQHYFTRTIHFRIEATKGNTPIIWMW